LKKTIIDIIVTMILVACSTASQASEASRAFEEYVGRYLEYVWETHPEESSNQGIYDYRLSLAAQLSSNLLPDNRVLSLPCPAQNNTGMEKSWTGINYGASGAGAGRVQWRS
jgi:hypothetical protein